MKKKIIIFIPSIEDGGVEKNLYLISNYLSANNFEIEILTCNNNKSKNFNKAIKFVGKVNSFWQNKSRSIKNLICIKNLFFEIIKSKEKPLIFAFQASTYAVIVAKILNTKIITRSNSAPSGWSKNFIKDKFYKFIIRFADDLVVNSIDFKNSFKKRFNIETNCIYNPFDKDFVKKRLKKKNIKNNFFRKNYLNIISIGRLTDQKDHLTLLKAINLLNENLKIRLAIIGKGTMRYKLQEYINEKKLQKKVRLIGYLKNPYPYIAQAKILVLTSKFEGLPNILLEAQYLKKYIISTNCPTGPKEILLNGKAGDLIKIGDYKKLAYLITNIHKRKKIIAKMIKTGVKNFDRFDYNLNCQKYLKFVKKNI